MSQKLRLFQCLTVFMFSLQLWTLSSSKVHFHNFTIEYDATLGKHFSTFRPKPAPSLSRMAAITEIKCNLDILSLIWNKDMYFVNNVHKTLHKTLCNLLILKRLGKEKESFALPPSSFKALFNNTCKIFAPPSII